MGPLPAASTKVESSHKINKKENCKEISSFKIRRFSFYLPNQIFDMFRQAVSSIIFQNSANGNFSPKKKKDQTQKQLGRLAVGYHTNFESKLFF